MAESGKITRQDIIADDAFTTPVAEAKELLKVITEISNALKTKTKTTADGFAIASPQSVEDVKKLTAQIAELQKQIAALESVTEKQKKASKDLTAAQAQENLARQKQRQEVTQQVKLNSDLTTSYEKQVVRLAQIKKELKNISAEGGKAPKALTDEFKKLDGSVRKAEESVGEHTRSVGNYKSALQGLGGPLGNAANGISSLGGQLKSLLANPYALAIAAIAAAIYGLFKAFTSTDSGATEWAVRIEQASAILDVVRKRALLLIDAISALFSGEFTEASKKFGEAVSSNGDDFERATDAARVYTEALDKLEDAQSNYAVASAKANLEISKSEFNAADRSFSIAQRRDFLIKALELSKAEVTAQEQFAKDKYKIEVDYLAAKSGLTSMQIMQYVDMTEAQKEQASFSVQTARNQYEDEFKALNEFRANVIKEEEKYYTENKKNNAKLAAFDEQIKKEAEDRANKEAEIKKAAVQAYLNFQKEKLNELDKIEKQRRIDLDKAEQVRLKDDGVRNQLDQEKRQGLIDGYNEQSEALKESNKKDVELVITGINIEFNARAKKLEKQKDFELSNTQLTANEKLLIEEKFKNDVANLEREKAKEITAVKKTALDQEKKDKEDALANERKVQQQVLQGIEQGTKRRSEIIQNGLNAEIKKQDDAIQRQQELAAKGLDNTLAYQEKKREELQVKLAREKEAERKREEALQLAGAFLGSYQSRLDRKQSTTAALAGALADTLIAKAISSTIAGAFAGGVEDFKGKGSGTSDSNLIAFSHGESVVTAKATQQYSGLVTAMNKGLVDDYVKQMILPDMDAPMKVNGNSFQSAAIVYTLTKELGELKQAIKNKQEIKVNWNAQGERVEEIVKDGMKTVIKHVTTGKRRL
jgi:hypothetical protein